MANKGSHCVCSSVCPAARLLQPRSRRRLLGLAHANKPFHPLLQSGSILCAASLDLPIAVLDVGQAQARRDLVSRRSLQQVLLVGEDEQGNSAKLVLRQELTQLTAALLEAALVGAVDHIHESIRGLEVVAPVRPNGLLAANVPNVELEAVLHEALDVETLSRHDVRDVLLGHLLQDCRLACVVQAEHEDSSLLLILLHLLQDAEKPHRYQYKNLLWTEEGCKRR
mmetsp:Transcript_8339/g.26557  ORF Transcript_8339/g.26557 Transcript_8339/m.26557 type:complete len:225 (+) Transcript_8339:46-720(+)